MKKNKLIKYIVPLMMLVFFARNLVLVETHHMDSWMGGGMRMFGKIDKMLYRVSGFKATHNGKEYFVNLRNIKKFEDEDIESRILPSDERLQKILQKVKKEQWCLNSEQNQIILNNTDDCSSLIDKKSIQKMEVYATQYDANNKMISLKLINSISNDH